MTIYTAMSDGTDPAQDMLTITGFFTSQPLDLDGDGVNDIKYSATKNNVISILNSLKIKLKKDDQLFIYVIDHGGYDHSRASSYICLWNEDKLYDVELASLLKPISDKLVNINVVLGQCYSGGFVNKLNNLNGCVVATASAEHEYSWACPDIPYDEFVYHWTCAVNQAKHNKLPVSSDTDNNGRVTMEEAFQYAKSKDRMKSEHPQYNSYPVSIGEDLAFNYLPPSYDPWIKDNREDTGKEPNTTTNKFWISPDIWIRNYDDGIETHENPLYTDDHKQAFIYVKIGNRGKEKYPGGKWLHIYWAQASPNISAKVWRGREVYNNDCVTGGPLEVQSIPEIEPGGTALVKVGWSLPSLLEKYPNGDFHFCLMAKILDTPFDETYIEGATKFYNYESNDVAQRNITIIKASDINKSFKVYIRNTESTQKSYTLELVPRTSLDANLYSIGNVEVEMSNAIYTAWGRGGYQSIDVINPASGNTPNKKVHFTSTNSALKSIKLNATEFDILSLKFKFTNYPRIPTTYTYDLIQKDENGNIVGGETFQVTSPHNIAPPIVIKPTSLGSDEFELSVDDQDFDTFCWTDCNGDIIGEDESVIVKPTHGNDTFSVMALTEKGDYGFETISLESQYGIESVTSDSGSMDIKFHNSVPEGSMVSISSVIDGSVKLIENVNAGTKDITIDIKALPNDIYTITYTTNNDIIDSKKIIL